MSKAFRPYDPDQIFLMPASMRDWLPSGHLAYFISDLVDHLNLSAIMSRYEQEERGYPPYHPAMMVKVLLYAYCGGVPSSRKIARRLEEDVAFRVLAANNTPDFRTISDFRKDHLKALSDLFLEVLKLCQKAGLVKLGHVSLDGTKMKANASKHKAMSYRRMKEEEERLKAEVEGLLKQARGVDEEEDRCYGKGKRGDELPKELAFRESRLNKIREAKEALEVEARQEAEQARKEGKQATGIPSDKAQRNFTDPDSHIMPAPGGKHFEQSYPSEKDSGGGGQRPPGHSGGRGHQPALGQRAGETDDGTGKRQHRQATSPDVSRCRLLLWGDGAVSHLRGDRGIHASGQDEAHLHYASGAPGPDTRGDVHSGPDAA